MYKSRELVEEEQQIVEDALNRLADYEETEEDRERQRRNDAKLRLLLQNCKTNIVP